MYNSLFEKVNSRSIKKLVRAALVILAAAILTFANGCALLEGFLGKPEKAEDRVSITPEKASVKVGEELTLTAESSEGRDIYWSSSDEEIATVDEESGVVTGVQTGEVKIIANDGKKFAACELTVLPADPVKPPEPIEPDEPVKPLEKVTITLSQTTATLVIGRTLNLTATTSDGKGVSWSSNDPYIAAVSGSGVVEAMSVGKTKIVAVSLGGSGGAVCEITVVEDGSQRKLLWSDEFDGNSLDSGKWSYQTGTQDFYGSSVGPQYWGNDELQYYTEGDNLAVSDGALQITARREGRGDRPFTSSRITTRDKYTVKFGYVEARMKTPTIEGMWPAFWMLPNPLNASSSETLYGGWAANGEIDIMEAKGRLLNKVDTTIHFGGPWPDNRYLSSTTTLSSNTDEWHTYAVDWRAEYIAWIIDGEEVYRLKNSYWWSSASDAASAPFDQPFYILLNLAVGGKYDPEASVPPSFVSATMYVDYVRVYS